MGKACVPRRQTPGRLYAPRARVPGSRLPHEYSPVYIRRMHLETWLPAGLSALKPQGRCKLPRSWRYIHTVVAPVSSGSFYVRVANRSVKSTNQPPAGARGNNKRSQKRLGLEGQDFQRAKISRKPRPNQARPQGARPLLSGQEDLPTRIVYVHPSPHPTDECPDHPVPDPHRVSASPGS